MTTFGVIGTGISGLSTAFYLAKSSSKVILFGSQKGVWIQTKKHDSLFELGPRTLRPVGLNGAIALDLVRF